MWNWWRTAGVCKTVLRAERVKVSACSLPASTAAEASAHSLQPTLQVCVSGVMFSHNTMMDPSSWDGGSSCFYPNHDDRWEFQNEIRLQAGSFCGCICKEMHAWRLPCIPFQMWFYVQGCRRFRARGDVHPGQEMLLWRGAEEKVLLDWKQACVGARCSSHDDFLPLIWG